MPQSSSEKDLNTRLNCLNTHNLPSNSNTPNEPPTPPQYSTHKPHPHGVRQPLSGSGPRKTVRRVDPYTLSRALAENTRKITSKSGSSLSQDNSVRDQSKQQGSSSSNNKPSTVNHMVSSSNLKRSSYATQHTQKHLASSHPRRAYHIPHGRSFFNSPSPSPPPSSAHANRGSSSASLHDFSSPIPEFQVEDFEDEGGNQTVQVDVDIDIVSPKPLYFAMQNRCVEAMLLEPEQREGGEGGRERHLTTSPSFENQSMYAADPNASSNSLPTVYHDPTRNTEATQSYQRWRHDSVRPYPWSILQGNFSGNRPLARVAGSSIPPVSVETMIALTEPLLLAWCFEL